MKYLAKPLKYLIGYLYLFMKYIVILPIIFILYVIWNFSSKEFIEDYKDYKVFYIAYIFNCEFYRYDSVKDFVNDNKNFKYKERNFYDETFDKIIKTANYE